MIKAILFDYYGVIGNDPLVAWTQRHQLNDWQIKQLKAVCDQSDAGVIDLLGFYEQLGLIVGIPGKKVRDQLEGALGLNGPLLELIRQIRRQGIKTGVLSNTGSTLRDTMQRHGIMDLFNVHIFSADYGVVKPEPQIFDITAKELNIPKDQILFFDDRQVNVDGARAAGMPAELYIDVESCRKILSEQNIF